MAEEWTLVLVKPDGVKKRHVGEVITRIERKGYQIIDLKMIEPTEDKLRQHYADKVNEPYFAGLMSYMTEGPIVGIIVAGATNPVEAAWGTIRGDFGREWPDGNLRNVVHTSDNPANAKREIEIWFPERTVVDQ
ncbi:nucleoside-diphosphate kinase [Limosilactobacillus fermentum]